MNANNMQRGLGGAISGEFQQCPECGDTGWTEWAFDMQGNCTECLGFGVVEVEHSPAATAPDDLVIVGDVLPDEIAAVLALTPHVTDDATWEEREAAAKEAGELAALSMTDSWAFFIEKPIIYEHDGNVLWAA